MYVLNRVKNSYRKICKNLRNVLIFTIVLDPGIGFQRLDSKFRLNFMNVEKYNCFKSVGN